MADTSSLITPPSGDISVAMLSQLFGGTWMNLLNSVESGSTEIACVPGGLFTS